jgi:hypothetical protein
VGSTRVRQQKGGNPDGLKQYVEAFFHNLDWDHVNRQLHRARAAKEGADSTASQEEVPVGR